LDGREHLKRRRLLNALLENVSWLKNDVLTPAIERNLIEVASRKDADGISRFDLVHFNMRVMQQMAAAIVGIDAALTADGVDDLVAQIRAFEKQSKLELVFPYEVDSVLPRALAARRAIFERYYRPAVERRERLLRSVKDGTLEENDLPRDLITLLLLHEESDGIDRDTAFREALLMLTAGTTTTALAATWTVHELLGWRDEHPGADEKLLDQDFLLSAFHEALRLRTGGVGVNLRRATEDFTLKDGTEVNEDDFVLIKKAAANRDAALFDDPDSFDPLRSLPPGVNGYGLSFGHGPHKCYGMPMVIGTKSTEGMAVLLLERLFRAGIVRDETRIATKSAAATQIFDQFEEYPVALTVTV
jgi:cytochrome P450